MNIHSYQWKQIRLRALSRDQHSCTWCGQTEGKLEVDHILPRSKGGDNSLTNLQTLCQSCHIIKSKKDMGFLVEKNDPSYPVSNLSPKGTMKTVDGDFV